MIFIFDIIDILEFSVFSYENEEESERGFCIFLCIKVEYVERFICGEKKWRRI